MFMLRQTSVKMAVLLHKQAKVPFVLSLAVNIRLDIMVHLDGYTISFGLFMVSKRKLRQNKA